MYKKASHCRICGNANLVSILNLGEQYLTGVFPKSKDIQLTKGPLELVKCISLGDEPVCGLVQLKHSYDLNEMYGETYGYRSGLNQSMVKHLQAKVNKVCSMTDIGQDDIVIDIGSNDATLLKAYGDIGAKLFGVDPSAEKFRSFYTNNIQLITDFFPSQELHNKLNGSKAKVITSISMFYDLEDPLAFVQSVYNELDIDGIWIFEQSYLPMMLKTNSYDTVCHEHLEYYCLNQIKWMMDKVGFIIVDVEFNNVNGGSFSVTVAKKASSKFIENKVLISSILAKELEEGYDQLETYEKFAARVSAHRNELVKLLTQLKEEGKVVVGYGASTKGNVVLQYCGITPDLLATVAEVNEDKFGAFTPGSLIPIVSEEEAKALSPDYLMVLPWHFRENFLSREQEFVKGGGKLIFPLPVIEIVS